jgi:NhaC family Na+:H+ antiporter
MVDGIKVGLAPILILLAVGGLIGSWMIAGTVPAMIYYGVSILDPDIFFAAAAIICALASISIGSSWTVAGTLGIGLMGIADSYGLPPAMAAGAIISGAYFGDKLSPLSDTTNLAAACTNVDLFAPYPTHVVDNRPRFLCRPCSFIPLSTRARPRLQRKLLSYAQQFETNSMLALAS